MRCGVVKIMPLGDSITEGFGDEKNQGGYRGPLYKMLVDTGFAVDFVGSKSEGNIPDPDHEGHSGHTALELIHDPETRKGIFEWLRDATPDVVLLHIGTNNIIRKTQDTSQIASEIAELLNEIDRYETAFDTVLPVILGRIINTGDPVVASSEITRLNRSIESMALARIAVGDRLA